MLIIYLFEFNLSKTIFIGSHLNPQYIGSELNINYNYIYKYKTGWTNTSYIR